MQQNFVTAYTAVIQRVFLDQFDGIRKSFQALFQKFFRAEFGIAQSFDTHRRIGDELVNRRFVAESGADFSGNGTSGQKMPMSIRGGNFKLGGFVGESLLEDLRRDGESPKGEQNQIKPSFLRCP